MQYSLSMLHAAADISRSDSGNAWSMMIRPEEKRYVREIRLRQIVCGSVADRVVAAGKSAIGEGTLLKIRELRERTTPSGEGGSVDYRDTRKLATCLQENSIDWALFTAPETRFVRAGVPYVIPIFDLQHRLQPDFPEVSADGEWECRENLYKTIAREAILILADSETGKEDILNCYAQDGLTEDRVRVLPYVRPPYLSETVAAGFAEKVREQYGLPGKYLFYPAQFWPHKNHLRIAKAIALLKSEGLDDIHLVLAGTNDGVLRGAVYDEVIREASFSGIGDRIHYLGYVPNDVMAALYLGARGLVMPTFFGPTNIPVLEAWYYRCPVLSSDIRGIREQVGNAGVLVDPRSVVSIAQGVRRLWSDVELRRSIIEAGNQKVASYGPVEFAKALSLIVNEACARVKARK